MSPPSLPKNGNEEAECNLPSFVEDESIPSTDAAMSVAVVAFALVAALSAAVAAAAAEDAAAAAAAEFPAAYVVETQLHASHSLPRLIRARPRAAHLRFVHAERDLRRLEREHFKELTQIRMRLT